MQTTAATFIFYELWMLGLSVSGVLAESVAHLATVALAHALASAFGKPFGSTPPGDSSQSDDKLVSYSAIYQAVFSAEVHHQFRQTVAKGACRGTPDVPGLSGGMLGLQQAVAAVEAVGLIGLVAIGWNLSSVSFGGNLAPQ